MDESLEAFLEAECKKNAEFDFHSCSEKDLTSLETILDILQCVANGMVYLEQKEVVHRDLRTSNVLLLDTEDNKKIAKIGDFGLSKFKAKYDYYDNGYQVISYPAYKDRLNFFFQFFQRTSAPELFQQTPKSSSKSDVWSFGILIYDSLMFGHHDEKLRVVLKIKRL